MSQSRVRGRRGRARRAACETMPSRPSRHACAKNCGAVADHVVAVAQRLAGPARLRAAREQRLALLERGAGEVVPVEVTAGRRRSRRAAAGSPAGDAFCRAWKLVRAVGRTTATSPSSSAVRTGRRSTASATAGNCAVQSLPLRLSRRDLPAVEAGEDAVAVELDLVQPLVARRRLVDQRGQLRRGTRAGTLARAGIARAADRRQVDRGARALALAATRGSGRPASLAAPVRVPDAVRGRAAISSSVRPVATLSGRASTTLHCRRRPRVLVALLDQEPALARRPARRAPLIRTSAQRALELLAVRAGT